MIEVALILLAAALTYAVSVASGLGVLGLLGARLRRAEALFLGLLLGSACLSLVVFLLSACGVLSRPALWGAGAVLLASGLRAGRRCLRADEVPAAPHGRVLTWLWWGIYGVFAVYYAGHALLPEMTPDAMSYHVAYVVRDLAAGRFAPVSTNLLAGMPRGLDMLFLFAYSVGGASAPAMVHLTFLLALPFGVLAYANRIGQGAAGRIAGLLVFLSPIVARTATCGYVDVALACVALGVFYALELWREQRADALLVAVGLLAGFAFAIKYTAAVALPYALLVVLRRQPRWRVLAIVAGSAALLVLPWLGANQVQFGNPLFPFANRYFPNPVVQPRYEAEVASLMRGIGGVAPAEVPLEVTVHGGRLGGVLGPLFLLSPLALLALRRREVQALLLAALGFGLTYPANLGTRFLIPVLPFVALALAMALVRCPGLGPAVLVLAAVLNCPEVTKKYADPAAWRLERLDWAAALRLLPEEQFLGDALPEYALSRALNELVPSAERVFCLASFPQLYARPELVISGSSSLANRYRDTLLAPVLSDLRPTRRYTLSPGQVRVEGVRLEGRSATPKVAWAIVEARFYLGENEVPRSPRWRLRALSNVWEAGLAFDNNPVTKWTLGLPGNPAESIDREGAHAGQPRSVQRGKRYPVTVTDYRNRGQLVATLCMVNGLGHAWSGGAPGLPYSDPKGPDASRMAWSFMQKQFVHSAH